MKLYNLLKIKNSALRSEITNAYSELAYEYREKKISAEKFDEIHWAFKILNNQQLRDFYDIFGDTVLNTVLCHNSNFIISSFFSPVNIFLGKIILIFLLPIFVFSPVIFNFFENLFFLPLSVFIASLIIFTRSIQISHKVKNHRQSFYYMKKIIFYNIFIFKILIFSLILFFDLIFKKMKIFLLATYLIYECINLYYKISTYNFNRNNFHISPLREYYDYLYMAISTSFRIMLYITIMEDLSLKKILIAANLFLLFFNKKMTNRLFTHILIFSASVFLSWYYYVNIGYAKNLFLICAFLTLLNYTFIFMHYPNNF